MSWRWTVQKISSWEIIGRTKFKVIFFCLDLILLVSGNIEIRIAAATESIKPTIAWALLNDWWNEEKPFEISMWLEVDRIQHKLNNQRWKMWRRKVSEPRGRRRSKGAKRTKSLGTEKWQKEARWFTRRWRRMCWWGVSSEGSSKALEALQAVERGEITNLNTMLDRCIKIQHNSPKPNQSLITNKQSMPLY